MPRLPLTILGLPMFAVLAAALSGQTQGASRAEPPPHVARFCGSCHAGEKAKAGFDIAAMFAAVDDTGRSEDVETALARVRSRTMPPKDALQPTDPERDALSNELRGLLPKAAADRSVTMRRLSRYEYDRTIRDLTGLEWDSKDILPEDARAYGFDNVGDVMTVSPLLFEKYYEAAGVVAERMLATETARRRAFADDAPVAETLAAFLARAFRRPPEPGEVEERLVLIEKLTSSGLDLEAARRAVLRSVFASPAFLFRVERGETDAADKLTPHEIAVRLSYFLTASMPDDQTFALARSGALAEKSTLIAAAKRLAASPAARSLADNFAAQWLRLRDVLAANADFRRYPQIWNWRLRPAFYEEAARFFESIVREDKSILTILDADHTYLNETLSKLYGVGDVRGDEFRRVELPDRKRGGILGMGAMLMVSSYPLRTSPVLRGKWILDQLLDDAPPPPPANAGVLPADDKQPDDLSVRERLERHRRDPSCASCHARIDPLGFALENYDVLGVWRSEIHGKPVDARAILPDGRSVDGPIALKDALLARKDDFARAFVKKMLVYALGRPLLAADDPEIKTIVETVGRADYHFSAVLEAVVTSPLFTTRELGETP